MQASVNSVGHTRHAVVLAGFALVWFPGIGLADSAARRINSALAAGNVAAAAAELPDARSIERLRLALSSPVAA